MKIIVIEKIWNIIKKNKWIFFIILFIGFQYTQIVQFKLFYQSDDFGYTANAAFFAGYNWNPYTGNMTPYYPIGFSIFAAIFFGIFKNPIIIYQGFLWMIVGMQVILYFLIYKINSRYLLIEKDMSHFFSLIYISGMLSPQSGIYFMAEIPFSISFFLTLIFLMEANNSIGMKRNIMSILSAIVLAYSYSIHSRFLISFIVIILVVVIHRMRYKKFPVNIGLFTIFFLLGFFITRLFVQYVLNTLYANDIGRIIDGNDALGRLTQLETYINSFFNLNNIKLVFYNFLSLLGTETLLTGGLFSLILSINILLFFKNISKKNDNSDLKSNNEWMLLLFGLLSFFMMSFMIAANGMLAHGQLKWLTFYRYAQPFVGVLLVIGLKELFIRKNLVSKYFYMLSFIFTLAFVGTMIFYAIPQMESAAKPDVGWFEPFLHNVYKNGTITEYFMLMSHVAFLFFIIYLYLVKGEKRKLVAICFICFSLIMTISENNYNIARSEKNWAMVDKTYEFMNYYEVEEDEKLYFLQYTYSGKLRYALYDTDMTYLLNNKELNNINLDRVIVFTDNLGLVEELDNKNYYMLELDKYEYLVVWNKQKFEKILMFHKEMKNNG